MPKELVSGTQGYEEEADRLLQRYEAIRFSDLHGPILHLIPAPPCRILDIGAGTGRDAAAFAEMGHQVVAVEPVDAFRVQAPALHPSTAIKWIADSLPGLTTMVSYRATFDLIMLTGVWMHLAKRQRRLAMERISQLAGKNGKVIFRVRHGPVPPGRRMFEVTDEETIELARRHGLQVLLRSHEESLQKPNQLSGVTWSRLVFTRR